MIRPVGWRAMAALCAVLTACATDAPTPGEPKVVRDHPITPYATHEECVTLAVGDRLDFDFTATEPVDFDLRYREGGAVLMPVTRAKTLGFSAIYAPSIAQRYCLAWEAERQGALVDYRFTVRRPPPR